MSRKRRKKDRSATESFSLSFLDAISCGFGALVILLVLTKAGEPQAIEKSRIDLDKQIAALQEELYRIRGQTVILNRDLKTQEEQVSEEEKRIARLRGDLTKIQGQYAAIQRQNQASGIIKDQLESARQTLSEEMKRLLADYNRKPEVDAPVGGIPVDSEYIIFIIDTSGSMKNYAWSKVIEKMQQTLNIYPKVKGIQIMNDMGQYMYSSYAGKWIPDTPSRRKAIISSLRTWTAFSNSSPVEGITQAIRKYAAPDKKVSIYVFGDEFTGNSIDDVVGIVSRINPKDRQGNPQVRIHGIGFPVVFSLGSGETTGIRFATLMRTLCNQNGGTFVALSK